MTTGDAKPLALDMCCGLGGWAAGLISAGWNVVGVDIGDFEAYYPGRFIRADLLSWEEWRTMPIRLAVASPPCEEFSRWSMPWTMIRKPPEPSLALVHRCRFIAKELGVPLVLENVRGAQRWLGRSQNNCGPFHFWGEVPAILPVFQGKPKQSFGGKDRAERAVIPFAVSRFVGLCHLDYCK